MMRALVVLSFLLGAALSLPLNGYLGYHGLGVLSPAARFSYGYSAPAYSHYGNIGNAGYALPYAYGAYAHGGYAHAPYAHGAYATPAASSQYHSQDEFGQYNYGYTGGPSSKTESKDAYGVTHGSYSYIDSNGQLQTANYVADALGFRVAATNLPQAPVANLVAPAPVEETPEVAAARAEHLAAHEEANNREKRSVVAAHHLPLAYGYAAPQKNFAYSVATPAYYNAAPYAHGYHGYAAPYAYGAYAHGAYAAPYAYGAYAAPAASSQYHSQDEFGQYNYGYSAGPSSKTEHKDAYGVTHGSYSYIDSNGQLQTANYVADALGFRVAATNLPQAPVANLVAPTPVEETPEVAAARAEHLEAHAKALEA